MILARAIAAQIKWSGDQIETRQPSRKSPAPRLTLAQRDWLIKMRRETELLVADITSLAQLEIGAHVTLTQVSKVVTGVKRRTILTDQQRTQMIDARWSGMAVKEIHQRFAPQVSIHTVKSVFRK